MIKVTPQQRANLLDALNSMWPSVPQENVVPRLNYWRKGDGKQTPPTCGTVSCFGGWCAWWPAFQEQGVYANYWGGPQMPYAYCAREVSMELFGCQDMFRMRGHRTADHHFTGTDHELVTHRLKWLLVNSEVAAPKPTEPQA